MSDEDKKIVQSGQQDAEAGSKALTKQGEKDVTELPKQENKELRGLDIQQFLKMLSLANKQPDPEDVS